jgi:hypothetical protein
MVSEKVLGAWPAHPHTPDFVARAGNAAFVIGFVAEKISLDSYPTISESHIYIIYSDRLIPVSFGNSAINDLYTADTPRA